MGDIQRPCKCHQTYAQHPTELLRWDQIYIEFRWTLFRNRCIFAFSCIFCLHIFSGHRTESSESFDGCGTVALLNSCSQNYTGNLRIRPGGHWQHQQHCPNAVQTPEQHRSGHQFSTCAALKQKPQERDMMRHSCLSCVICLFISCSDPCPLIERTQHQTTMGHIPLVPSHIRPEHVVLGEVGCDIVLKHLEPAAAIALNIYHLKKWPLAESH